MSVDRQSILKWNVQKRVARVGELIVLAKKLDPRDNWEKFWELVDELILVSSSILAIAINEIGSKCTPSELLLTLIEDKREEIYILIRYRVLDTTELVRRYNLGLDSEKRILRPVLKNRGLV